MSHSFGDSRIYVVRGGSIAQLSRDHTEVQQLLAEAKITPEEARNWPGSNVITRAIGVFDQPELEITSGALEAGDTFVLCSDGLTHHIEDAEILHVVSSSGSQQACDALIELTLARGATDNVTVIIVRYQPDRGDVTFHGTVITGWAPSRIAGLGLGRTFQTSQLFSGSAWVRSMSVSESR